MGLNVVSLGAWCRPAYHIRNVFGQERAYPHDWNITSYKALLHTLSEDYDPASELMLPYCRISQFDSIVDDKSGIIYQHDLQRVDLDVELSGPSNTPLLIDSPNNRSKLDQTRSKSVALHDRMKRDCSSGPTVFVRWIRSGHPDSEWAGAFDGEWADNLYAALRAFCGHDRIRLAHVVSSVREAGNEDWLFTIEPTAYGVKAAVFEQPHTDWTGDAVPWHALLEKLAVDWADI